ncbi:MAG TPA: sporulation membrane protein YtaF [Parasulfuritortus sp.]
MIPALLSIFLIALSSNLDNIGVGTSYGVRRINIPFASNLLIALVTSLGTFLSVFLGEAMYHFISERTAGLLGGGIIIAAGLWIIYQEKIMHRVEEREVKQPVAEAGRSRFGFHQIVRILNNPFTADWDFSGHIDLKEATALALGLTINNFPNGVGAGILHLNIYLMTATVFLISIITIWTGIYLGQSGVRWLGKSAALVSGLILIFVGAYEILF